MRHSALEDGALKRSSIHVCIEVVAAHIGKVCDVRFRDGMLCCVHRRAHFQLFKMLTEDVRHGLWARCSRLVLLRNGCDIVRVALDGRAVQIVQNSALSAHLFTTSGTTWTAVFHQWHRRTVTGTFLGHFFVDDVDTSVVGRRLRSKCNNIRSVLAHN